jgi:hypothetical protein
MDNQPNINWGGGPTSDYVVISHADFNDAYDCSQTYIRFLE